MSVDERHLIKPPRAHGLRFEGDNPRSERDVIKEGGKQDFMAGDTMKYDDEGIFVGGRRMEVDWGSKSRR